MTLVGESVKRVEDPLTGNPDRSFGKSDLIFIVELTNGIGQD